MTPKFLATFDGARGRDADAVMYGWFGWEDKQFSFREV